MEKFDPLKIFSNEVAEKIVNKSNNGYYNLLSELKLVREKKDYSKIEEFTDKDGIGIWTPVENSLGKKYKRSEKFKDMWHDWADVENIEINDGKKKVVVIGESVARGYFYDPAFTPAKVLAQYLENECPEEYQIIDLAKNDLDGGKFFHLVETALVNIKPDLMLVFAGNNWVTGASKQILTDSWDRRIAASIVRNHGIVAYKKFIEYQFEELIKEKLGDAFKKIPVPILWIIPEFNLKDWGFDDTNVAPWLSDNKNIQWWENYKIVEKAIKNGRYDQAAIYAKNMVELDNGTSPQGLKILAQCKLMDNDNESARELLEKARDSRIFETANHSPRIITCVQNAIRESVSKNNHVVDLKEEFSKEFNGKIPDDELFLDYCHLTSKGIKMVMEITAEKITEIIGQKTVSRKTFKKTKDVNPSMYTESLAWFLAAVHSAHYGQQKDSVEKKLRKSISYSNEILSVMKYYLEIQSYDMPPWMSEVNSINENDAIKGFKKYVRRYNYENYYDSMLLNAIGELLETNGVDIIENKIRRIESWSIKEGKKYDFLDLKYQSGWTNRCWDMLDFYYYREYQPVSKFPLVYNLDMDVNLKITCRQPDCNNGTATIYLNDKFIKEINTCRHWKKFEVNLKSDKLLNGENWLEIFWTQPTWDGNKGLEKAARNLEIGRENWMPVWGEIHSMTGEV